MDGTGRVWGVEGVGEGHREGVGEGHREGESQICPTGPGYGVSFLINSPFLHLISLLSLPLVFFLHLT